MSMTEYCDRFGIHCNLSQTRKLRKYCGQKHSAEEWAAIFERR